tara:strand:+ start:21 stop:713 length:693 start_codon:yes stop_codon:yes gene_type:complete
MKKLNQNYVYFGRASKQTFTAAAADDQDHQLTAAEFGNVTQLAQDGTNIKVTVKSHDGGGTRGASSGSVDAVTGIAFASQTNTATGETTLIPDAAVDVHASNGTVVLGSNTDDGNTGYAVDEDDIVTVELEYTGVEGDSICYPMANYLGADPISETRTALYFKSIIGDADTDEIKLFHTTGKYKDVCKMMAQLSNATPYSKMVTVADPLNSVFYDASLGITDVHINQDLS